MFSARQGWDDFGTNIRIFKCHQIPALCPPDPGLGFPIGADRRTWRAEEGYDTGARISPRDILWAEEEILSTAREPVTASWWLSRSRFGFPASISALMTSVIVALHVSSKFLAARAPFTDQKIKRTCEQTRQDRSGRSKPVRGARGPSSPQTEPTGSELKSARGAQGSLVPALHVPPAAHVAYL